MRKATQHGRSVFAEIAFAGSGGILRLLTKKFMQAVAGSFTNGKIVSCDKKTFDRSTAPKKYLCRTKDIMQIFRQGLIEGDDEIVSITERGALNNPAGRWVIHLELKVGVVFLSGFSKLCVIGSSNLSNPPFLLVSLSIL